MLFFTLDMAFLLLAIGYADRVNGAPREGAIKAGGVFGILAAFLAWYNALAGIADTGNRYAERCSMHSDVSQTQSLILPQLLSDPGCSLSLVREGTRKARKGRQQRSPCRRRRLSILSILSVISLSLFSITQSRLQNKMLDIILIPCQVAEKFRNLFFNNVFY